MITTISIVSHGNFFEIRELLSDLNQLKLKLFVILTLNIPEKINIKKYNNLEIKIIKNRVKKGFGENHNQAFQFCKTKTFMVINPDVRLLNVDIIGLIKILNNKIKIVAPTPINAQGKFLINGRKFPTLLEVMYRFFLKPNIVTDNYFNEYPDWVSGMFMVIDTKIYNNLGGFDENFYMYFEDVDICKRLRKKGYEVFQSKNDKVIHEGKRKSNKNLKFFIYHLKSLIRYFFFK